MSIKVSGASVEKGKTPFPAAGHFSPGALAIVRAPFLVRLSPSQGSLSVPAFKLDQLHCTMHVLL